MLPGGATVPGRALIDTLPLVWQVEVVPKSWQLGRAQAAGAERLLSTAKLAIINPVAHRIVTCLSPLDCSG